ncbi:hypothetical protein Vafri_21587 [Volvox africanus]|uniref:Beta-lactamase-related domain-containing protein n=1 Tax=Volvox africanus TaxID=51714 RepID=A0A8J4BSV0_9CHLO|nr:hypothetical protein Vafri_21587 [Volvox africanus]
MDFARPDAIEAFLHLHVYKELQESGVSGATVCVAKLGRYSFTLPTCYGFADASRGVVLDPRSSLFDLGTCAKLLAALALLQLLQESGLTVTADVNSMLPPSLKIDTSRYGTVTVQHLLTHTSGLQRGNGGGGGNPDMRAAAATEDDSSSAAAATGQSQRPSSELPPPEGPESRTQVPERGGDTLIMSYLLAQPVYCAKPPGTYRPCDVDYMLIGAIIEYLTAEPYDTYTKDVLLDPLGIRLPPQPREPQGGGESGAAAAAAMATVLEAADGTTGDRPSVFVHVRQQDLDQARPQARAQDGDPNQGGGPVVPSTSEGAVNAGGGAGMEVEPPREPEAGPSVAMDKKVLARYDPPQLTPVGGLVLTAVDIGRLLPLFLHNSAAAGGDQDGAGSGGVGRSLLASLYEIRLYDFTKDVGVAYGGLVSLGLGHCGDRVVSCESPPPPPSTREIALTAQATAQAAAQAARAAAADAAVAEAEAEVAETEADGSPVEAVAATGTEQLITDSQPPQDQDPDSQQLPQQQSQERVGEREQQPRPVAGLSGGGVSGGGVSCRGSAGGGAGTLSFLGHPSLLLVAPDSGFALLVACNTAGPEGTTFCRHVAVKLLERYRPAELPRSVVRSWLAPVPPPRQDAIVHLVAFPPSCCLNPITYFDGWSLSMPDYVKVRRGNDCCLALTSSTKSGLAWPRECAASRVFGGLGGNQTTQLAAAYSYPLGPSPPHMRYFQPGLHRCGMLSRLPSHRFFSSLSRAITSTSTISSYLLVASLKHLPSCSPPRLHRN